MSNIELIFPEIFISLSIMFLLILGVFKKDSSKIIHNISLLVLLITAVITFNETLSINPTVLFNESIVIDYLSSFMNIITLLAAFKDNFLVAVLASLGVIIGAAYMLWLYKRVIFGKLINSELKKMIDLNKSEVFVLTCLAIPTLYFGFYPEPLINTIEVSISDLIDTYNFNVVSNQ